MNMQMQSDKGTDEQRESSFRIKTAPDASIEPGHQWLVLPNTPDGTALAWLLMDHPDNVDHQEDGIRIAHTAGVDQILVELIDQLAHVRFSAPGLVQLALMATPAAVDESEPELDAGLEGA